MSSLAGADLLSVADLGDGAIEAILEAAGAAKGGESPGRPLEGRQLALIFQRPSNRTRVSFEVAIRHLGGHPIPLFQSEIQLGERESPGDIARILGRYVDGIVARLVSHRDLLDMAAAISVPTINAMTDAEHPCQALADLLTIRELCGKLDGVQVAYIGDGNNVCTSLIYAAALTGIHLGVVCPAGYEPHSEVLRRAEEIRRGGWVRVDRDPAPVLERADIVYTDVWTSMGQEAEQQRRREDFAHLQVNDDLLRLAPAHARVLHCLPAHRGEEITDSVLDGPQAAVFDQAENRMWVQQALLGLIFAGASR